MKKTKKVLKFLWKVVKLLLPYVITAVENRLTKNCKGGECNEQNAREWEEYLKRKNAQGK